MRVNGSPSERAEGLRRILARLEHTLPHGDGHKTISLRSEDCPLLRALVGREIEREQAAAAARKGEQDDAE